MTHRDSTVPVCAPAKNRPDAVTVSCTSPQERPLLAMIRTAIDLFYVGANVKWFRGEAKDGWPLRPKIHREFAALDEAVLGFQFKRQAPGRRDVCPDDSDHAGWLSLMQHYGLPTRLLDWTASLLVAAFFAVAYRKEKDAAVIWVLDPEAMNTTLCPGCAGGFVLSRAGIEKGGEQNALAPLVESAFGCQDRKERIAAHGCRWPEAVAVYTPEIDARIVAQQSRFTIHDSPRPLNKVEGRRDFLRKIVIPARMKLSIEQDLKLLNVHQASLFPDLDHLASELTDSQRVSRNRRWDIKIGQQPPTALLDAKQREERSSGDTIRGY